MAVGLDRRKFLGTAGAALAAGLPFPAVRSRSRSALACSR